MNKNKEALINKENLKLRTALKTDLEEVMSWFTHPRHWLLWAGPSMVMSHNLETFIKGLNQNQFQSYALIYNNETLGFGQIQLHKGVVHLGRLVISPKYRAQRLSYSLMNNLIDVAMQQAEEPLKRVSLYVYKVNKIALRSYTAMGFVASSPPKGINAMKGCDYMLLEI